MHEYNILVMDSTILWSSIIMKIEFPKLKLNIDHSLLTNSYLSTYPSSFTYINIITYSHKRKRRIGQLMFTPITCLLKCLCSEDIVQVAFKWKYFVKILFNCGENAYCSSMLIIQKCLFFGFHACLWKYCVQFEKSHVVKACCLWLFNF